MQVYGTDHPISKYRTEIRKNTVFGKVIMPNEPQKDVLYAFAFKPNVLDNVVRDFFDTDFFVLARWCGSMLDVTRDNREIAPDRMIGSTSLHSRSIQMNSLARSCE
jgi:hypothetical protein